MKTVKSYFDHTTDDLNYLDDIPYLVYTNTVNPSVKRCVCNGYVILWDYRLDCIMMPDNMRSSLMQGLMNFYNRDNLPSPTKVYGKPKIDLESSIEHFKDTLEANISDLDSDIEYKLKEVESDMTRKREELDKLKSADNLELEIEITEPLVASYSVSDGVLKVHTKYLSSDVNYRYNSDTNDFGEYYGDELFCYWGEFLILIPIFSDSPEDIEFYNLTRSEEGYEGGTVPHPHIIDDPVDGVTTKACWGEFAGDIAEAMAEGNWDFLISLIIRFLLQPDTEDSAGLFTPNFMEFVISNQYRSISDVD